MCQHKPGVSYAIQEKVCVYVWERNKDKGIINSCYWAEIVKAWSFSIFMKQCGSCKGLGEVTLLITSTRCVSASALCHSSVCWHTWQPLGSHRFASLPFSSLWTQNQIRCTVTISFTVWEVWREPQWPVTKLPSPLMLIVTSRINFDPQQKSKQSLIFLFRQEHEGTFWEFASNKSSVNRDDATTYKQTHDFYEK